MEDNLNYFGLKVTHIFFFIFFILNQLPKLPGSAQKVWSVGGGLEGNFSFMLWSKPFLSGVSVCTAFVCVCYDMLIINMS